MSNDISSDQLNFNCKVIIEDISFQSETVQSKSLSCKAIVHKADSRIREDKKFLQSFDPIAKQILWPVLSDKLSWQSFDEAVHSQLTLSGSISLRLESLENTIITMALSTFGTKPHHTKRLLNNKSRRVQLICKLVHQKNNVIEQIELASSEFEIKSLNDLLFHIRGQLRVARRAENSRKRRWQRKKARSAFHKNPYKAGKDLLSPKSSIQLEKGQAFMDDFLSNSLSDPLKEVPLGDLDGLPNPPHLSKKFARTYIKETDFYATLKSRRNGSAPGPNNIPYIVYKNCPLIARFLYLLIKSCYKNNVIPIQWRIAHSHFIPKVDNPKPDNIADFRQLALMNVEAKIFWALISRKIYNHLVKDNNIINTSVQKGSIESMPGCWEHLNVVWASLKDAKLNNSTLASIWLDIANAYGSIPHQLIFFALERYGLPPKIISIIKMYYAGLWSKSNSFNAPSGWHQHQKGIFAGCTVSVILFLAGMNVALEYIQLSKSIPYSLSTSSTHVPLARAFMDDLNLLSNSIAGTEDLLRRSEVVLSWARLSCRATKSRSFVCTNGKISSCQSFSMLDNQLGTNNLIPSIQTNPIKFLGRIIDGSLSDTQRFEELEKKLTDGLILIDKSFHTGLNKSWILQYLLIPKIQWPLMVYEFPLTKVEKFECVISKYLRKWLGLSKSISNVSLYGKCSPCPLPFSSISSIFKCSKARGFLQLRDSKDTHVSNAGIDLSSGRKWSVIHEVESAEQRVDHLKVMGHTQFNRAGLGSSPSTPVPHKGTPAYRKYITASILQSEDEKRFAKAVQLSVQGQWTKWQNFVSSDLSWKALWAVPPALTRFCIGATYDTLPSPNNLQRWGLASSKSCPLCPSPSCTVAHILSGCSFSLRNGRYLFRHNEVLKEVVLALNEFLTTKGPSIKSKIHKVKFVKPGHQPNLRTNQSPATGILHLSSDWELIADLDEKLIFPPHIAETTDRPDIVIFSKELRRVLILELTCPCEENFLTRNEAKTKKYAPLKALCEKGKWTCDIFAFEVGARGYCSKSLAFTLRSLGLNNKLVKSVSLGAKTAALRSSFWIWLSREDCQWKGTLPYQSSNTPESPSSEFEDAAQSRSSQGSAVRPMNASNLTNTKPIGIKNIGNTCYISSILQSFKSVSSIYDTIQKLLPVQSPLLKALQLVFQIMNKNQHNYNFSVNPSSFVDSLYQLRRKDNPQLRSGQQEDAHEILIHILSQFSVQISNQLFNNEVVSTISCSVCHTSSSSKETISVFQLPVRNSLNEAFNSFLSPETLDGGNEWFCPECNKHQISVRQSHIASFARVLIIQLKRFSIFKNNICKNNNMVHFPLTKLSLPCKDDEVQLNRKFDLKATINHVGNLNSGHYKSMSLNNNSWYVCNDSAILDINAIDVVDASAYMLFFETV